MQEAAAALPVLLGARPAGTAAPGQDPPRPGRCIVRLTFGSDGPDLGSVDLDEDNGDLVSTGGNLYLYVDGVEIGSLWFNSGEVTLGFYSPEAGDWSPSDTLLLPAAQEGAS